MHHKWAGSSEARRILLDINLGIHFQDLLNAARQLPEAAEHTLPTSHGLPEMA
jgi:hypothetical protein